MECEPYLNEVFWELYVGNPDPNHHAFREEIHYNSLTSRMYQTLSSTRQAASPCWIPKRIIKNTESPLFHQHKKTLIDNVVPCITCVDGYFWVVNDDLIRDCLKDPILLGGSSVELPKPTA